MTIRDITPLIDPKSIAIVGASNDELKFGGRPIKYMKDAPFGGPIYPINPKGGIIQGLQAYSDIRDVGKPIDMAVISVPAPLGVDAIRSCAEAGVKSCAMFTSGFAEVGGEGIEWQNEISRIAEDSGMLVLGPNCLGMLTPENWAIGTFTTIFDHGWPKPGGLTIMTQSGAVGGHILVMARERGIGIRTWAATGNESDVDVADCIAFGAQDPKTEVITAYMEGCKNPDRLIAALELAQKNEKPVICMKVGASEVGAEAAATHTASLAGSDAIFDAVFRQYGVHRAHSIEEMMDVAHAVLTTRALPAGRRLGVVTVSGGAGVMACDQAERLNLEVPEMPPQAQKLIKDALPYAAARNPIDVTATATNQFDLLYKGLEAMLDHGKVNSSIIFMTSIGFSPRIMKGMREIFSKISEKYPDDIMAISMMCKPEDQQLLENQGFLVIEDQNRAIDMLHALTKFREGFDRGKEGDPLPDVSADLPQLPTNATNEFDAAEALRAAGIPFPVLKAAKSADEAVAAATEIGQNCVMKVLSSDIQHKSDIGGVKLNIAPADAGKAFDEIMASVTAKAPDATVDGVLIAPMAASGVETIVGVVNDAVFGPTVMVGLGGIFVEVLKDVSFRVAPFGVKEAKRMISELTGLPLLQGARGAAPADIDALAETLSRLSVYAARNADRFDSIDINPFLVQEQGAVALDAVIAPK